MKIITVVGMIGEDSKNAQYTFDKTLHKEFGDSLKNKVNDYSYLNMLHLLISEFGYEKILALHTKEAKEAQLHYLSEKCENLSSVFEASSAYEIVESEFDKVLETINNIIKDGKEDKDIIIDLTHGFRHISILATISIISSSIKDHSLIKHIFFAKEIESRKEYKIIDLKEYLELANMSYLLAGYTDNYTLSSSIKLNNQKYINIANDLNTLSNSLLSNSLKNLLDGNFLKNLSDNLKALKDDENIKTFSTSLDEIICEVNSLLEIIKKDKYECYYDLSQKLLEKGYLLNAITLLYESIGFYCLYLLGKNNEDVKKIISKNNNYKLTKDARIYFAGNVESTSLLFTNIDSKTMKKSFPNLKIHVMQKLIKETQDLRNSLAHGDIDTKKENSSESSKKKLKDLSIRYKNVLEANE